MLYNEKWPENGKLVEMYACDNCAEFYKLKEGKNSEEFCSDCEAQEQWLADK